MLCGLINGGKLINRSLTSGSRCSGWAAWSRVISNDARGFIRETTVFFKTWFRIEKAPGF